MALGALTTKRPATSPWHRLPATIALLFSLRRFGVQLDMFLARQARMLVGMNGVPMRDMRMVRSRFVVTVANVLSRRAVMFGGLLVMLRRLFVQFL
ncbi:MAG TPA: hypothetical protein VG425_07875 [Casimicrobiaceae bacterium]|nr:hypothetical protein [Casimicrobiaceae bacterium]